MPFRVLVSVLADTVQLPLNVENTFEFAKHGHVVSFL